ncbi:MAG: hypothetical protein M1814_001135 [Vezdaea aestivalis]|nr:MAG: hypothetical protein M1814_001135 [Vezdaea aestivalis]
MHYALPPNKQAATIAPSLQHPKKGVGTDTAITNGHVVSNGLTIAPPYPYKTAAEPQNPTVLPLSVLRQFHFTFLIRHPRYSIPSYFRCTVPPLAEVTGFYEFYPSEAGYDELRRTFDYLRSEGVIGPDVAGAPEKKGEGEVEICVVDADDLLNKPAAMIEAYCASVGINYNPDMLTWDSEEDHEQAKTAFEKWRGFHEDAINSTSLRPRTHAKTPKTSEQENAEWAAKFGDKDAKVIRETVDRNVEDYEYLKQFALKV